MANLRYMRSFFLAFPILNAVGRTLPAQGIRDAVRHKSTVTDTEAVT